MAAEFAFVSSIAASPTMLLNLHNFAPFHVKSWSAPPPALSRSVSQSSSRDGSNVSQSSYADREITIELAVNSVTRDEAAEAIQALSRMLNSDGQWLRVNLGTIEPVYFRTKRAEIDQVDDFNGTPADGFRVVTVTIPAEPFAYGLPVSGTATINNDPTAATNPMSYVFPAIQGDVATPVSMSLVSASSHPSLASSSIISLSTGPTAPLTPIYVQPAGTDTPPTGWAFTAGYADANAISGTAARMVKSSGSLKATVATTIASSPPGDYRLAVRAYATADGSLTVTTTTNAITRSRPIDADSEYHWYDMGVLRLPELFQTSQIPDFSHGASSGSTGLTVGALLTGATGEVRVDAVLLIPASLDDAPFSSLLLGGRGEGGALSGWTTYVDSVGQQYIISRASTVGGPISVAGGFPSVLPSTRNVLTFIRSQANNVGSDPIATGTVMTYLYYPRYLYIRPATS